MIGLYERWNLYKFEGRKINEPQYFWFSTPDYADVDKKMWIGAKFGIASSSVGILFISFVKDIETYTLYKIFKPDRWLKTAIPITAVCMAGCTMTAASIVTLANIRGKKDDRWNYLLSGLPIGWLWSRVRGNPMNGFQMTCFVGFCLYLFKRGWEEDWRIMYPRYGAVGYHQRRINGPLGNSRGFADFTFKEVPDAPRRPI